MVNIGLLGLGTVGTGVIEILRNREEELTNILGKKIKVKKILVKNLNKKRDIDLGKEVLTNKFEDILKDEDIDIIVEVTGDLEESYRYILESIKLKKHIVTANKAVVSKYFEEISSLADENNVFFLYEGSVAGGIPIIKPLLEETRLNEITNIQGILNGTCNYILTKMMEEGLEYGKALKYAQEKGYAEADPTDDVEGYDSLRKLRILGTLAFRGKVAEEEILLQGINKVKAIDIENIKKMGCTIKLIGEMDRLEAGYTAIVQPTIISNKNYFANVNLAFNSVSIKGDNIGELKFYGLGAGKLATANAILRDVIDIVMSNRSKRNPLGSGRLINLNEDIKGRYYLRISKIDDNIKNRVTEIEDKILSSEGEYAVVTRDIRLKDLKCLLSGLEIEDYFIGRIL